MAKKSELDYYYSREVAPMNPNMEKIVMSQDSKLYWDKILKDLKEEIILEYVYNNKIPNLSLSSEEPELTILELQIEYKQIDEDLYLLNNEIFEKCKNDSKLLNWVLENTSMLNSRLKKGEIEKPENNETYTMDDMISKAINKDPTGLFSMWLLNHAGKHFSDEQRKKLKVDFNLKTMLKLKNKQKEEVNYDPSYEDIGR